EDHRPAARRGCAERRLVGHAAVVDRQGPVSAIDVAPAVHGAARRGGRAGRRGRGGRIGDELVLHVLRRAGEEQGREGGGGGAGHGSPPAREYTRGGSGRVTLWHDQGHGLRSHAV